ncbi:hypothetical protein SAMN05216374_0977 [Tardiphaga sp. OK246]|uniref:hypothetical protein n=1 Tax=Tardiphaga sp. OK246 TaxID=1855307 RepID=UPI000B666803|nr:hypothetical protein [Tardiphaga sp. OK246]SNS36206.1 hypothetical protein SAMN05216374_0977 [Tardiphaga sp. OK246]
MTTTSQALAVVKGLIEANPQIHPESGDALPFYWQGDDAPLLPETPSPFIYTFFEAMRSDTIEIGGGRGRNRHRNPGAATIFVFVPIGWGLQYGTDYAEALATPLRSYRQNGVTVEGVTVYPGGPGSEIAVPGMDNEAKNYFWSGLDVEFYHDLIG